MTRVALPGEIVWGRGWRCGVCGADRAFHQTSVAYREPGYLADRPDLAALAGPYRLQYCNDDPRCIAAATAPGPWPPIERTKINLT